MTTKRTYASLIAEAFETRGLAGYVPRDREQARINRGTYEPVPWAKDVAPIPDHYVHISTKSPGMVSYTPDAAKGGADRQVVTKPGRYLTKFYPDMSADEVREWATKVDKANEVHFADTADEIERVYTEGPSSCMSYKASYFSSSMHPVRVYESPDLKLAYITDASGNPTARALVWPDKKLVGRIYGDWHRLKDRLVGLGYTVQRDGYDDLIGARIKRIPDKGSFVMPYIDGSNSYGSHSNEYFTIGGEHDASNTSGLSNAGRYCPYLEDYVDADEDFYYIEDRHESISQTAFEQGDFFHSDRDGCSYSDSAGPTEVVVPAGWSRTGRTTETWTRSEANDHGWYCEHSDQWLSDDIEALTLADGTSVDPKWAEDNCATCKFDGELYLTADLVLHEGEFAHPDNVPDDDAEDADTLGFTIQPEAPALVAAA